MKIPIRNSAEFGLLLSALADELVAAKIHLKLYQGLAAAIPEYGREYRQSWTFWSLTFTAHFDAAALRLCKAYDQYGSENPPLNLRNFLDTIDANKELFDEPNFRERLKGNPFVDSLAAAPRKPDPNQLKQDIESVSASNPLVKKLTIWRNNFYAHCSKAHALDAETFVRDYPLSIADVQTLLENGLRILNRYSDLFVATIHSTNMIGRDDYLSLLKALREGLDAYEARIEEEIKRFT
jgi:AbiU2